ncbi:DUF6371 domain-containing protein [Flagellimonas sp.]|uniref:DUF6371 domain-containing protein n=1 Tax=Flagellimonas sp. TaxID=2058762 RepID=UPI003BA8B637
MKQGLKFDRNRKRVKYCPCGRSNRNQKFVPFLGEEKFGYCHSCEKTFVDKRQVENNRPFVDYTDRNQLQEISYHDEGLVIQFGRHFQENNFIQFLKSNFDEESVKQAILKYCMGTPRYWIGDTVFWQIDTNNKVRHGKIMLYDKYSGKRVKRNGRAYITSVRAMLKLENFNLNQCLFGLHLLNENFKKPIALVEGEKTAILLSIFKPEYTWMATGSKQGFKESLLKPLKKSEIVAFPDKGEYVDWETKARLFNRKGYSIRVDEWLENHSGYPEGTDLADVLIDEEVKKERGVKNSNSDPKTKPYALVPTMTEKMVKYLAKRNDKILYLIDEFDLIDQHGSDIRR